MKLPTPKTRLIKLLTGINDNHCLARGQAPVLQLIHYMAQGDNEGWRTDVFLHHLVVSIQDRPARLDEVQPSTARDPSPHSAG